VKQIRPQFGLGSKLSLIGVAVVVVWTWASQPPQPDLAQLRSRVTHGAPPPLKKPEPKDLLSDASLSPHQRRQIEEISSAWEEEKKTLLASLNQAAGAAPERPDLESLKKNLGGYSELSKLYDFKRDSAWKKAVLATKSKSNWEAAS